MGQRIDAIFEDGLIRPLQPLDGVEEHARLKVNIEIERTTHMLEDCIGILPDTDAQEMLRIMDEEFEKVDENDWR